MEKMTRMSKYKELRESLKNDVVTTEATQTYVSNETAVKDINYYRNLVGEETNQAELTKPQQEDTLYERLTFDTITENETEEVKTALDKVRETNGQEQYNTRMDILNKIRQSKVETPVSYEEDVEEETEEVIEEVTENRFGYHKEEVKEEIIEEVEEDEDEEEQPKKRFGFFGRKKQEEVEDEVEDEIDEDEEDEEEEGSSFMVKLLNGCIVVLVLVLIGLVAFIAKEILF